MFVSEIGQKQKKTPVAGSAITVSIKVLIKEFIKGYIINFDHS